MSILSCDKDKLTEYVIANIYVDNMVEFTGEYHLVNIIDSFKNCFLVVSAWENDELVGLCSLISDGVYYGRIQELILAPKYEPKTELITDIIQYIYNKFPTLKFLHLNPGVVEKKLIYMKKHSANSLLMKKLYWTIHEDEF